LLALALFLLGSSSRDARQRLNWYRRHLLVAR